MSLEPFMTINIDLQKLEDLAHVGVRRATIFMGLGLNAAHKEDFNDYELSKLPVIPSQTDLPIELIPRGLPVERVQEFKKEFATWVTACGMRELLEPDSELYVTHSIFGCVSRLSMMPIIASLA